MQRGERFREGVDVHTDMTDECVSHRAAIVLRCGSRGVGGRDVHLIVSRS